ncbi:MAG: hypothetical protein F6K18_32760 [Okeania sp. SIO2C2]|nr:hypothetical protein [Okeania sp. SIO2C2]
MELSDFIENKLNDYAKSIIEGSAKRDEIALGEMTFYMTLRRALTGKATLQDIGMLDAINDTLQEKGVIEPGKSFYK